MRKEKEEVRGTRNQEETRGKVGNDEMGDQM